MTDYDTLRQQAQRQLDRHKNIPGQMRVEVTVSAVELLVLLDRLQDFERWHRMWEETAQDLTRKLKQARHDRDEVRRLLEDARVSAAQNDLLER